MSDGKFQSSEWNCSDSCTMASASSPDMALILSRMKSPSPLGASVSSISCGIWSPWRSAVTLAGVFSSLPISADGASSSAAIVDADDSLIRKAREAGRIEMEYFVVCRYRLVIRNRVSGKACMGLRGRECASPRSEVCSPPASRGISWQAASVVTWARFRRQTVPSDEARDGHACSSVLLGMAAPPSQEATRAMSWSPRSRNTRLATRNS